MSTEASRRYNYTQARQLVDSIGRIIERMNPKYTPQWLMTELNASYHKAQCIQREFKMVMRDFGDKA